MKKDRWIDWTEYGLLLGSGAGAVASVATQQAILAAAPLSLLAALGLMNRRQLELQLAQNEAAVQSVRGETNSRLNTLKGQVEGLPTHDYLKTVRQSIAAQQKQDILSLSQVVEHIRKKLAVQIEEKELSAFQELRDSLGELQEHYTALSVDLKDVRSRCQQLSDMSRIEATETVVGKLETDLMQLRVHLDMLGANAKNTHAGLEDRLKYLSQQVQQLTTEEQRSLLKEEVQQLVKTVTSMVSRDEFLRLSDQLTESTADKLILHELNTQASNRAEHLQHRLDTLEQRLGTMTDSILEAVAETVDPLNNTDEGSIAHIQARLEATDEQLNQLTNAVLEAVAETLEPFQAGMIASNDNQWLLDFGSSEKHSNSRQALEQLLRQARERVVLVWPWAENMALDDSLLQQFRQVLQRGCRLEIGWCHRGNTHGDPLLRLIDQRWRATGKNQGQLKHAFKQLLQLKQDYSNLFSFKILGTTENFAVGDTRCALIGMQPLPTQTSLFPMVHLKLRTEDPTVIQSLIQQFETPVINVNDTGALFNRGITRYDISAYGEAVEDFTQVIKTRPSAAAYNWRGVAWVDVGDVAKALQDFGKAVRLDASLFEAHCNRGALRITVRDYQGALSDLETAAALQPTNAIPYFYQARALQLMENYSQAVAKFGSAIERQPNIPLPYCYRAMACQKQGNIAQAITDLETAAGLMRNTGDVKNLNQVMRQLQVLKQGRRSRMAVIA
ncbi:MAG: hypothetical protein AAFY17_00670 [Cyanobacteria bacterium J06642_11]